MTFAPKKKTSKSRSRRRTTNWIRLSARKLLNRVQLQYQDWKALWFAHFAKVDGTYKGKQVFEVKSNKKNITRI